MEEENNKTRYPAQKMKYSFFKIMTGSDLSRRRLPFMSIESTNPGPVVWLTGCIHGDEVGGIVVIHEIFKKIGRSKLLKGALFAFPLMNPIGFETGSHNISMSKEDLNRSFPGNASGSLEQRIAYNIFTSITSTSPTLVFDLHNDWRKSIPYCLIELSPKVGSPEVYETIIGYAHQTGLLVVDDTEELKNTISVSLIQHNIPAITLELGESYVVNEVNVMYGINSIMNILARLGMIAPQREEFSFTMPDILRGRILGYSSQPVSSTSGIIRFMVSPGAMVRKGQPIAKIYNAFGKLQETLNAQCNGIVLGIADSSVAFPGAPVMAFGVVQEEGVDSLTPRPPLPETGEGEIEKN